MKDDQTIIKGCIAGEKRAQRLLYDKYSALLFAVCLRYTSCVDEAEDVLQETFLKVFLNIDDYQGSGSFAGWLNSVAVNTSITHYHKNREANQNVGLDESLLTETSLPDYEESQFTADELRQVLNELPPGYRMVFNLYAIEGYKHKEIAKMLGIDTATSKSQYSRAKALIRVKLERLSKERQKRLYM